MKFKPSINQTIRGLFTSTLNNKKYNTTEQPIQLKISAKLSKSTDANVLPLILTISYSESIPDLVVNLNTGDKTFLTTFVNNIELFEFKVKVQNPNSSPAIVCIQESIIESIPQNNSKQIFVNQPLFKKEDEDVNIVFANSGGTPTITSGNNITIP
jgi:hypothetical protein